MIKKLLLFSVLLLSKINNAQVTYFHYLDYTSEWRNYYTGWNGWCCSEEKYTTTFFDADTIINGNSYYRRFSITNYTTFSGTTTYTTGPSYFREDSLGRFLTYSIVDNIDYVEFDNHAVANMQIGDTFVDQGTSTNCTVSQINVSNIGSLSLKHIYGSSTATNTGLLEGVGFVGLSCSLFFEQTTYLNCYTKQGNTTQLGTVDCSLFPSAMRMGMANYVSEKSNQLQYDVYPNPTSGKLNVNFSSHPELVSASHETLNRVQGDYAIKLTDVLGKEVLNENYKEEIDVSYLQKGIYFLSVYKGKELLGTKKIVKE